MRLTRWLIAGLCFVGCGSPIARALRQERFGDACALQARGFDREGDDALRDALFSRGDLRVHVTVVPEAETERVVGVAVAAAQVRVARVRVEAPALFPDAKHLELESLMLGDAGQRLDWAGWDRALVDTVCAPRPPPPAAPYRVRPYTPTPRPDVPTRTVRRSTPERVIGGVLGALSLGLIKTEDSVEVTTPQGEAKLRRWAEENEKLLVAWDAVERQHAEEAALAAAEANARAARWPTECRDALTPHLSVQCSGKGALGTLRAGDACEWTVLLRPPWQAETKLYVFSTWRFADGCALRPPGLLTSPLSGEAGLVELFKDGPRRLQR